MIPKLVFCYLRLIGILILAVDLRSIDIFTEVTVMLH